MKLLSPLCLALFLVPPPAVAQVYEAATINTKQFMALDRGTTAVIIPGGILEQHGPYLPSDADGLQANWLARTLAQDIAAQKGWSVLLLPEIVLGHGGANVIGRRFTFPGTISVRAETVRAVYMDLADSLRDHGFKWVFLVHIHGAPRNNQALYDASDYFTETSGGRMVHLFGLTAVEECCSWRTGADPKAVAEDGFTVHAGVSETSRVMFVAPQTVNKSVADAPSITGKSFEDLARLASDKDWPGYFGAPRYASPEIGERVLRASAEKIKEIAWAVLLGRAWPEARFYVAGPMDAEDEKISRDSDAVEEAAKKRQVQWLEDRRRR